MLKFTFFSLWTIYFSLISIQKNECFVPAKLMDYAIMKVNKVINFTQASNTLTHEEIIKRGIITSAAKYFYDQSKLNGSSTKINLTKLDSGEYFNLKNLYYDYYGSWYCTIDLENLIITDFQPNVAIVDFDKDTKDLPYAHFDAETFQKSNDRVIQFTNDIFSALTQNDYKKARKLSGQISHTIQDFYSHSNWVEMGNQDINLNIGSINLNNQSIVMRNDNFTCNNNCNLTVVECSSVINIFVAFIKALGIKSSIVNCPLRYYICKNNVLINDKLLSGYYGNQKLDDGTLYEKPQNLIKCSHGGIMDTSSLADAIGGINKDSGYYMFSPHAYLHLTAANLAIKHTAYFFDQIRSRIGNYEYSQFLRLSERKNLLNNFNQVFQVCGSTSIFKSNSINFLTLFLSIFNLLIIFIPN